MKKKKLENGEEWKEDWPKMLLLYKHIFDKFQQKEVILHMIVYKLWEAG